MCDVHLHIIKKAGNKKVAGKPPYVIVIGASANGL
jgi:hypothetical protein